MEIKRGQEDVHCLASDESTNLGFSLFLLSPYSLDKFLNMYVEAMLHIRMAACPVVLELGQGRLAPAEQTWARICLESTHNCGSNYISNVTSHSWLLV